MRSAVLVASVVVGCGARTELWTIERSDAAVDAQVHDASPPRMCRFQERALLATGGGTQLSGLAVDDHAVYWTSFGTGSVESVAKVGGLPVTLVNSGNSPNGIAVANGQVFWTDFNANQVASVPVDGGAVSILAQNQNGANGIAVADQVYWTTYRNGTAARAPQNGGPVQILSMTPGNYVGMATDGQRVFWTVQEGPVMVYTIATQSASQLASGAKGSPWSIVTDGVNVYWNEVGDATGTIFIARTSMTGGSVTVLGSAGPKDPSQCPGASGNCQGGVATDGQSVYFTVDASGGSVWKVPVSGGSPVPIAQGEFQPYGVAVDDACVYWGNWDGTVMAAPK